MAKQCHPHGRGLPPYASPPLRCGMPRDAQGRRDLRWAAITNNDGSANTDATLEACVAPALPPAYNTHMRPRGWARVLVPILLVVAATMVPYVWATYLVPKPSVFDGFLLNPLDGFSYLAKMRQGAEGSWLFRLPYAADPGPGVFLFVYYLLLGHVSRFLHANPLAIFHGARGVGAIVMFLAARRLLEHNVPEGRGRNWGFAMILVGSGLGWMGLPFGLLALDLWVPEAIPALAAYASAHFPLAVAALCLGGLVISPGYRSRWRIPLAGVSGLALALLQPFAVGVVAIFGGVWLGVEVVAGSAPGDRTDRRGSAVALLALLAAASPIIVYDAWAVLTHPALAAWNRQNLTPSPSLIETGLAFLPLLGFAIAGLADPENKRRGSYRILIVWSAVTFLLLYAPFGLQRRLALGVYVPLAVVAAIGLTGRPRLPRWLPVLALLLTIPSHVVVVAAGLSAVARQEATLVLTADELTAYRWMDDNLREGSLVLAGPRAGNRIPAFADVRVVYGHPFETPNAESEEAWVEAVYAWTGSPAGVLAALRARGVEYVYVGKDERSMGPMGWITLLTPIHIVGEVAVYEAPPS